MLEWLGGKKYKYPNTRQYLRLPASWPIKLEETAEVQRGGIQVAATRDVSAGGVAIVMRQMVPVGSQISTEIHVPALQRSIRAKGRVVRCLPMHGGGFDVGIQFLEIDPKDRVDLKEAIEKTAPAGARRQEQKNWWRKIT